MTPWTLAFVLASAAALIVITIRTIVRANREADPGRVSNDWIKSRHRDEGEHQ